MSIVEEVLKQKTRQSQERRAKRGGLTAYVAAPWYFSSGPSLHTMELLDLLSECLNEKTSEQTVERTSPRPGAWDFALGEGEVKSIGLERIPKNKCFLLQAKRYYEAYPSSEHPVVEKIRRIGQVQTEALAPWSSLKGLRQKWMGALRQRVVGMRPDVRRAFWSDWLRRFESEHNAFENPRLVVDAKKAETKARTMSDQGTMRCDVSTTAAKAALWWQDNRDKFLDSEYQGSYLAIADESIVARADSFEGLVSDMARKGFIPGRDFYVTSLPVSRDSAEYAKIELG